MTELTPTTADEIASVILEANQKQQRVAIDGVHCQTVDQSDHVRISTSRLNQLIDYPFDDMTITVQAGMAFAEFRQLVSEQNQQLPIDVPDPSISIGQLVDENVFGPRISGYGTLRDYLIGIQAVDGQGRVFRSGGRVVKNVAGYDLCRLLIGNRGRLAVITECTFKLNPLPTTTAAEVLRFESDGQLQAALLALNTSEARPVFLDLHTPATNDESSELIVGVEGSQQSCDWQLDQICQECQAVDSKRWTAETVRNHLADHQWHWQSGQIRVRTRRSQSLKVASAIRARSLEARSYIGLGILHCSEQAELLEDFAGLRADFEIQWDRLDGVGATADHLTTGILNAFDPNRVFSAHQR